MNSQFAEGAIVSQYIECEQKHLIKTIFIDLQHIKIVCSVW